MRKRGGAKLAKPCCTRIANVHTGTLFVFFLGFPQHTEKNFSPVLARCLGVVTVKVNKNLVGLRFEARYDYVQQGNSALLNKRGELPPA